MKKVLNTSIFLIFLATSYNAISQELPIGTNYFEAAKEADKNGDFRKSADLCLKGLKRMPINNDLKQQLGKSYMQLNKLDSARYFLTKVAQSDYKNVTSRYYLVNVEYQSKRYTSAICYINELLEKTPYLKGLWLKKISIYKEMGNYTEVKRSIKRLIQIFPNDSLVKSNYNYIMTQEGLKNAKAGNSSDAKKSYLNILKNTPDSKDTYISLINIETTEGKLESALVYAEKGLKHHPNDLDLIKKKLGLLESLDRYDVAIGYLKSKKDDVPKVFYSDTERYLTSQAARFYENTDPYVLHQKSYSLDRNYYSYRYLLNKSVDLGHYNQSLRLIDDGLKRNPNDKDLLVKQMFVYKQQDDISKYRNSVYLLKQKFPNDYDINQEYASILYAEAKEYASQKQYQAAIDNYIILLNYPDYAQAANNNIFAMYTLQNNRTEAFHQIDMMIEKDPKNVSNLVKKAEYLKDLKEFDSALNIVDSLIVEYSEQKKYKQQYVYYSSLYMKHLIENQLYYQAVPIANKSLEIDNTNQLTYRYAINASSAMKWYDKMLIYADSAVYHHPDNLDFKLNRISAYSNLRDHQKATELLEEIEEQYSKDLRVKGVLAQERFKLATLAEEGDDYEVANTHYNSVLLADPTNIPAYQRLVNLSIKQKFYENALIYIDRALEIDPNAERDFFIYKKGIVYEMMGDYSKAYEYQKLSLKADESELKDHVDYLLNKPLKNLIGINYLRATSGEENYVSGVAGLFYKRILEKNNYGLNVNYATRSGGDIGLQLKAEWAHIFSKTFYAQIDASYGNIYFPKFKVFGSAYKYLKHDWEAGLGVGITRIPTGKDFFNLQGSLSKDLGDFWVNTRVNILSNNGTIYNNLFAQARYNINDNGDYVVAMASTGNAPQEDITTSFQVNPFLTYVNSMVGAGYKWNHKHKYTYGIQGNWYSFYMPDSTTDGVFTESTRVDQYHLLFTIQTKF